MKQVRLTIDLTLVAPILTQASTAGRIALDAPFAKLPDEKCFLPFSLVKGRLRQSWDELSLPDAELWFGKRKGEWSGSRGRFRFSDFVEQPGPARETLAQRKKTGEIHRIRIDPVRGAADEGALQFIESPFPAGERVTFRGNVTWFDDDAREEESRASLLRAFRWTGSFGAGRTIGFGRVDRVETPEETRANGEVPATTTPAADVYAMRLEIHDPFCLARKRIDENLFSSDEVIPGAVVRGVLATTLNRLLGGDRDSATPIVPGDARGTEWNEIADHLNAIRISHSFPAKKDSGIRPVQPPLSLVHDGDRKLWDVALCEGPVLIGGSAPVFSIDWKGDEWAATRKHEFDWPEVHSTIRTRTAIDRETKRAETARLFSYEMIDPIDLVWIGTADFSAVDAAFRAKVVSQFECIFAMQPAALGKTKARVGIHLTPAAASTATKVGESTQWVVTLQTPVLLCDPARLNEASGRDALFAAYAAAWKDISNEELKLVRFFASQSLTGGYLAHRFGRQRSYAPFLLTDPGSVFVLKGSASGKKLLEEWKRSGLPLPEWARLTHGETWQKNPYLPCDGFGEIEVDLESHTKHRPAGHVPVDQWPDVDLSSVALPVDTLAHGEQPLDTTHRANEDTTVGTIKRAGFSSRWRISGRLETQSDFHLGSGGITRRDHAPLLADVDISAVSVDKTGAAYIPGSSLKGAVRSWASVRFAPALVDAVFGGESDNPASHAGKAEFHNAMSLDPVEPFGNVPYWDPGRRTGVTASVAIDRWTRTAQDKKLFHSEVVPPGVVFDAIVTAHDLNDEEAALLLQAMRSFGQDSDSMDDSDRLTLGAETRGGFGRFLWSQESVSKLDDVQAWTGDWNALPQLNQAERERVAATLAPANHAVDTITIGIDIAFDGPFLVNEPSRTNKADDQLPNQAPRVNKAGDVMLPAASLRGALRAQAEKIARTVGLNPCHSTDPSDACDEVREAGDVRKLCVVCGLFGATGWASPVTLLQLKLTNRPEIYVQELVAIDRFTGGASGSAKFRARVAWMPQFRGAIRVTRNRVTDEALGLLALTLRDLADGDISLGFGRSKGFGGCRADVPWLGTLETEAFVKRFRGGISQETGAVPQAAPVASSAIPNPQFPAATEDPDLFHNPYHFIPIPGPPSVDTVSRAVFSHDSRMKRTDTSELRHLTHDRYAAGTYSGRIICRLTTEGPLVVGGERRTAEDLSPVVVSFTRGGTPYIPATTLRGLLSSIAEAASNSAMRVLNNEELNIRVYPAPTKGVGSVYDYFERAFGPEILPFNPSRGRVTLAEQLFGFVELESDDAQPHEARAEDGSTNAFAGRVRISFGKAARFRQLDRGRSRILGSPKPPAPSLYFKPVTGEGFIAKTSVRPGTAIPQGRKVYVHHKQPDRATDWITQNDAHKNQKNWLTPIDDSEFWFHLDFDNLTQRELGLLCYSIRPSESFRHKLGLGKALGLGTVRIDPTAVLFVDRASRYADPDNKQRYSSARSVIDCSLDGYPIEQDALSSVPESAHSFLSLRDEFKGAMNPAIARAFELFGDPQLVSNKVHTPQVPRAGSDLENETYRWFVVNETGPGHQYLKPITAASMVLPTLHRAPTAPTVVSAAPARPVVMNQIVNLQFDGAGRLIIARNTVNNLVEAEIPRDSTRPGVKDAATRLALGARLRGRIRARLEGERYSIISITDLETMPDA